MLRVEQEFHLREAAFCEDADLRAQHRGVFRWLEEFLNGTLTARYAHQAREKLGLAETPAGLPTGGSDYMEGDGLGEEE